jgi:outer membrane lipase/esterase
LTQYFNLYLGNVLTQLSVAYGIDIARLDAYGLLTELVANPGQFGLADVTTACVTPDVAPFACTNPDEFLFWDGIHPNAAVHGIIAQRVASVLGQ